MSTRTVDDRATRYCTAKLLYRSGGVLYPSHDSAALHSRDTCQQVYEAKAEREKGEGINIPFALVGLPHLPTHLALFSVHATSTIASVFIFHFPVLDLVTHCNYGRRLL